MRINSLEKNMLRGCGWGDFASLEENRCLSNIRVSYVWGYINVAKSKGLNSNYVNKITNKQ